MHVDRFNCRGVLTAFLFMTSNNAWALKEYNKPPNWRTNVTLLSAQAVMIEHWRGTHTVYECCYMLLKNSSHRLAVMFHFVLTIISQSPELLLMLSFVLSFVQYWLILSTGCVRLSAHVLTIDLIKYSSNSVVCRTLLHQLSKEKILDRILD